MKKILYLIPHLEKSSPVTQLYGIINYLDSNKYKAVVLSFFKERPESNQAMFTNRGVKVINGNLERWQLFKQKSLLKKIIENENPDIVHSCSVLTDGICSNVRLVIPLVLTLHSYIYEDIVTRYGNLLGNFMCNREEKAIRKATVVVTVSKTLANKYKRKIKREFVAIQNGIETSLWQHCENITQLDLRRRLGLPLNAFIVLSTNLLDSIKDPLLLIHAFSEARIPNSFLVMLGDGNLQDECMKYKTENILFTGRVSNVKDYLYAADVLVSASKSEGLPYAILEAACSGIKMILTDIPQHEEVMGQSEGVSYFNCGNKELLIKRLKEGNRGRVKYNLDGFTSEHMSKRYQEIYALV